MFHYSAITAQFVIIPWIPWQHYWFPLQLDFLLSLWAGYVLHASIAHCFPKLRSRSDQSSIVEKWCSRIVWFASATKQYCKQGYAVYLISALSFITTGAICSISDQCFVVYYHWSDLRSLCIRKIDIRFDGGNLWCFKPRFCTVRLHWAGYNLF